ncbi:MAG: hypothetical protein C5B59_15495 [Bacteroidetes bacterium]|nr:MAG: hypothetical protein C5B59_15495 [Bacteroidota bacterium]
MNVLTEIQYFPSVISIKNLYNHTNIFFEQYEFYQKRSFRNRALIAGSNGIINLSIPLLDGRNQKVLMKDVRIANQEAWQKRHWRSIFSSYNHSPWFDHYRDELEILYLNRFEFLMDWNLRCFEWVAQKLNRSFDIFLTETYQKNYDPGSWIDQRNRVIPKNYRDFETASYRQVFEEKLGFLPNLSIIDLLFCEGGHAADLLKEN